MLRASARRNQTLKIFVCEFITSGGLYRAEVPESLAKEGLMMRDALLGDLAEIADIEVVCSHDARFPAPVARHVVTVDAVDDIWQFWQAMIRESDAVWPIAPETGGVLSRLSGLAVAEGRMLLGCAPSTVDIAASKLKTAQLLQAAGVSVATTETGHEWLQHKSSQPHAGAAWVIKPDNGVSCDDTVYLASVEEASIWLRNGREMSHVVQPYLPGEAISLSMLCRDGQAWLLSCNRQRITLADGRFAYRGGIVNGANEHYEILNRLAQQIAAAMPDLAGYIGVDVLLEDGVVLALTVLEINPRLTTSYAGLHAAIGVNPALLLLRIMRADKDALSRFKLPKFKQNIVEITL